MTDRAKKEEIEIIQADVEVLEYAHGIFSEIKRNDGVTNEMIMESLNIGMNRAQAFSAGEASGKSGSFFFFSHDGKFIIKTMRDFELELFIKMIPDYFVHLKEHKYSLIARFYGAYTVKMEDVSPVSLVVMANTAQVASKSGIRHVFDLKGSFINRKVKVNHKMKPTLLLKI